MHTVLQTLLVFFERETHAERSEHKLVGLLPMICLRFLTRGLLVISATLTACTGHHAKVENRPTQFFSGHENVLLVAPKELLGAEVRVDGHRVGYLWPALDVRNTGVDEYYKPPFPAEVPSDSCATRLFIPGQGAHELVIQTVRYVEINRTIDVSMARPLLVYITSTELARRRK